MWPAHEENRRRRRHLAPKKGHWSSSDEEFSGTTTDRHSDELQLPKLAFISKAPQLRLQGQSNAASHESRETTPVHHPFEEADSYEGQEIRTPVHHPFEEAASNAASYEGQEIRTPVHPLQRTASNAGSYESREIRTPVHPLRRTASNAASYEGQDTRTPVRRPLQGTASHEERSNERMITLLEELKEGQKQIIQLLLQQKTRDENVDEAAPERFSFPLKTEEDLKRLEEDLEDRDFKKEMIRYLSSIGGDSTANLVRSILRRLFSTPLALQYNFTGAKGKKRFATLRIRGVMMTAVWKTFASATEIDINNAARKWFVSARDRDGGRHRRSLTTADSGSSSRLTESSDQAH